jgi:hypothetical protein
MKLSWRLAIRTCGLVLGPLFAVTAAAPAQVTGGPYQYFPLNPCRVVDSRSTSGYTILTSGVAQNVTIRNVPVPSCGVPTSAKGVVINLTGVSPSADGFITIWPGGTAFPGTSNVNLRAGVTLANLAVVPLGTSPNPDLSIAYGTAGGGTSHFIIDVVGYFQ